MEMTDKQRAWWFANHPEYSHGRKGSKRGGGAHADKGSSKIRAADVDAYVDNALQYADESVAELLKSVKQNFGTDGEIDAAVPKPTDARLTNEDFYERYHYGPDDSSPTIWHLVEAIRPIRSPDKTLTTPRLKQLLRNQANRVVLNAMRQRFGATPAYAQTHNPENSENPASTDLYRQGQALGRSSRQAAQRFYEQLQERLIDLNQARNHSFGDFSPTLQRIGGWGKKPGLQDVVDFVDRYMGRFGFFTGSDDSNKRKKIRKTIKGAAKALDAAEKAKDVVDGIRPSSQQTEIDVGKKYGPGTIPQQSFKSGEEVRYGLKGSIRVDQYHPERKIAIEGKNYNLQNAKGRYNLVYKASEQIKKQRLELPKNVRPLLEIDIRGQKVSKHDINNMKRKIVERSDGIIKHEDIKFMK